MIPFTLRAPLTVALAAVLATTFTPVPQAVAAPAASARPPRIPPGTTAAYMVFDRTTGRATLGAKVHTRFRSASVVKILIAVDYLESHKAGTAVPARDRDLLRRMLRSSDDDAATALWTRGGRTAVITRMVRRMGLTDTGPPPASKPGFWGYTALSAADVVRAYRYLLDRADPKVRDLVLGHLRNATRCAADDFDQYFGIPSALPRPWAVKQGWSGYGARPAVRCSGTRGAAEAAGTNTAGVSSEQAGAAEASAPADVSAGGSEQAGTAEAASASAVRAPVNLSRPVLHTTGLVGKGDRLILVVLTLQPAGATFRASAARLTAIAKDVYRAGLPK
ncbi:serine hydrolase [Sphaerisporangium corydalis]|uniref:Serine hydrolase n=1 Tax=Sphaerisporangium corydalis TaxID=1441875 RepID=A0ABV9EBK3_9ACTN|nr:hypothetical protein [Sphaerisporangium corydalis]